MGHAPPHVNFRTNQGPKVSVSNIMDIAFYGCFEIIYKEKLLWNLKAQKAPPATRDIWKTYN